MVVCDEIQIIRQINEDPRSLKFIQKLSLTFTNDKNVTAYVAICDCSSGNHNSSPNLVILVFFFYLCRPQSRSSSMAKKTETVVRQQQAIPLRQNTKFTKQIVQHKLWSEWIFFRHIRAGNTLTRYTSLEGMSMRSHLCQGDMTRHPSPKRSFSDSWRSETFEYFISDSHIFAAQRSYFSLFIRISLCNQPAGKQDRKLPN